MSTVKGSLAGLAVLAGLLVAACVTPGPVGPGNGGDLPGTSWVLSSMPGANGAMMPVPSRPQVTLQFRDGGSLGGSGGCNLFGGSYRTDAGRINISQLFSTLRYCEEAGVSDR
ncbi:MAG: META domain-containing protein, partial [Methanomicrobiales archaeon]|nr:META domain-containing protein [Methanomicrobiales archaeon]